MSEELNVQQAIRILGCSRSHFYNLVNSGDLPSSRNGKIKGVRVKKSDCLLYKKQWRERIEESLK